MSFLSILEQFVQDLRGQKLRTSLTILGITWGTVAVIVLLAFGVGFEAQSRKNMHGMGDGIVVVFGGRTTQSFEGFPDGRQIQLREDDARLLEEQVREITAISPEYRSRRTPARNGTNTTVPALTGVYPVYSDMRNIIVEPGGRFLNEPDLAERRRVAVLGDEIKRLLFGEEEAVGRYFHLGDTPFLVVGVMQPKTQNSSYFARDKDRLFIPASTYRSLFGDRYLGNIIYRPAGPELSEAVERQVFEILGRRYRFDPTDDDALGIWDTTQADTFMRSFFVGFNIFMAVIGSFTLTVGGIGVANIMYVVVRERTRAIGIMRSVGARRTDVLRQFFLETFFIVGIGALLGFGLAAGLVELIGMLPVQEFVGTPRISSLVAAVTVGLLALIALFAGFFPARKASRLDVVACLTDRG